MRNYGRHIQLPINYDDLFRHQEAFPLLDKNGKDTLWETLIYDQDDTKFLNKCLTRIYTLLKIEGEAELIKHLYISRIDYCTFGNSHPFRIKVVNQFNDNYDYFYVKKADASRIYGLELEHILSPNRINYMVYNETLIEEHIAGIPGDDFVKSYFDRPTLNKVRLGKEFIKFNERCFVRLLGDMRSYNFVIDVTPDFEDEQYRIRPIDFDQQSYEGKHRMYLPQFFKDNNPYVKLCLDLINPETAEQYQNEERTLLMRRVRSARHMLVELLDAMMEDNISSPEKVTQLKNELANYHQNDEFLKCENLGEIVRLNLKTCVTHRTDIKATEDL